jgi:hypothetical protein
MECDIHIVFDVPICYIYGSRSEIYASKSTQKARNSSDKTLFLALYIMLVTSAAPPAMQSGESRASERHHYMRLL